MEVNTFTVLPFAIAVLVVGSILSSVTFRVIIELAPKLERAGLAGRDLNKGTPGKIPEDGGLGPSAIFSLAIIVIAMSFHSPPSLLQALFSILTSSFLGFADDVVNLRWRYKLIVPAITLLPVSGAYNGGPLQLGPIKLSLLLTRFYCLLFAIFAQNAVNIYAGINGLEVGQSVIACVFLLAVVLRKLYGLAKTAQQAGGLSFTAALSLDANMTAAGIILVCFIAVSLPLYALNKYPSRVFVGDIYAYFAGSAFASACILSRSLIVGPFLFFPQIINFLLSIPQLFGIVPCPRHRLPQFSSKTGLLTGIRTNLNLLNQYLCLRGPMHEKRLCRELLFIQAVVGVGVFVASMIIDRRTWIGFRGVHKTL